MLNRKPGSYVLLLLMVLSTGACKLPAIATRTENKTVPAAFKGQQDSVNSASLRWRQFFKDPYLTALIDTALQNNQELNITLQEIEIARNEARARKGEYLPFVGLRAGSGIDKVARYTNIGAMEAATPIAPGRETPDPLPDYALGAQMSWEVDIWHKLRNARQSAIKRYLSTIEGRNFVITNLIAEIAGSYYELLSLDNQLDIINKNIEIQSNALKIVKLQKQAARVTELGVTKFEAEVLKTRSMQYGVQQQIIETENRINFLLGRYPQHIARNDGAFDLLVPEVVHAGIPSQLLLNRPDIRQAEQALAAARLDVKVARAQFYPSLGITAAVGYRAFNPSYLLSTPQSLLYSMAGDLMAPLVNRNAIKAAYSNAGARQVQAVYNYERTVLNAYMEVVNQLSKFSNLQQSYDLRSGQVQALTRSINLSNELFLSARADYMEVLMTQRDALESKIELIETKQQQMNTVVNVYRALGGGWN